MIQHVFERASQAKSLSDLVIATDDQRIFDAARTFGAPVRMTASTHASGTDRAAEVAAAEKHPVVVNIQGDEPLIDPAAIDSAIACLLDDPSCQMATLKKRIDDPEQAADPNVVKVVTGLDGRALYFSRSPIPFFRSGEPVHYRHIGLYAYRREFLLSYPRLPVGPLERCECLEQLRALENGYSIRVAETAYECLGVDTPQDLERVLKRMEALDRQAE